MATKYIEIKNIDELAEKLDKLGGITITTLLDKACLLVENSAKLKCPVDTGELRNSITHEVDGTTGVIGTNLHYAPYVEYGTGVWARDGNGRKTPWVYESADGSWHYTVGQHPQPFLEPALQENRAAIVAMFDKSILEEVE